MEKWEMCILGVGMDANVTFYSPQNDHSSISAKDFIKKFIDAQFKGGWNDAPGPVMIKWLLDNGWEPYAHIPGAFYFRRKLGTGS